MTMTTAFPAYSDTDTVSITVRKAVHADIPALCELEVQCFSSPWTAVAFEDFFANGCSHCLVAEYNGTVCGYVGMNLIDGEGEITNLAVSENFRRLGIGKLLMKEIAATDGLLRLMLDVRVSNEAAKGLYEKLGFKTDGIRKGFYSKPREDAILMSLYL